VTRYHRTSKGQSLIELGALLIVAIPVILLLIDCSFVVIGAATNDAICRDVTRAAASGPPGLLEIGAERTVGSGGAPYQRIKHLWITNMPMKVRETVKVFETLTDVPPDTIGGAITGSVSVETTVDIYPSFLIKGLVGSDSIVLSSRHTVPYTYVMPRPAS
jgi:hypothetical protein